MGHYKLSVWDIIQRELRNMAKEKYDVSIDLVKLLIAVIISAGKEQDLAYLGSDQFLYHCFLCGLNSDHVAVWLEGAWKKSKEV